MKKKNWYTSRITLWIFVGLALGVIVGFVLPHSWGWATQGLGLISSIYMNALRMMIFPLVFCSIVVGIMGIGSIKKTGRIGGQTLLYFIGTTLFASLLGLFLPEALGLGKGVTIAMSEATVEATKFSSLLDTVKNLIPANPIASFATGDMLQVLVFAIIVGATCLALGKKAEPFVKVCDALNEISVKIVSVVMYFTPIGVFASIAGVVQSNGLDTVIALGGVLLALYITYILYVVIVYGGLV